MKINTVSIQFSSLTQLCPTLWNPMDAADQASPWMQQTRPPHPSPTSRVYSNSYPLSWWSNHLILCSSLLFQPSIFPSIRVFSNESVLRIRWPKYWSFCFSISPSNEHPALISFRMHWLDLLAVQETLKSLLQHYSSKALILRRSAFFTVQLSHSYMTTGKTIALTRRTFIGKVMWITINCGKFWKRWDYQTT